MADHAGPAQLEIAVQVDPVFREAIQPELLRRVVAAAVPRLAYSPTVGARAASAVRTPAARWTHRTRCSAMSIPSAPRS